MIQIQHFILQEIRIPTPHIFITFSCTSVHGWSWNFLCFFYVLSLNFKFRFDFLYTTITYKNTLRRKKSKRFFFLFYDPQENFQPLLHICIGKFYDDDGGKKKALTFCEFVIWFIGKVIHSFFILCMFSFKYFCVRNLYMCMKGEAALKNIPQKLHFVHVPYMLP